MDEIKNMLEELRQKCKEEGAVLLAGVSQPGEEIEDKWNAVLAMSGKTFALVGLHAEITRALREESNEDE